MTRVETDTLDPLLLKMRARHEIGGAEAAALAGAVTGVVEHPADHRLIERGRRLDASTVLLDGFLGRVKRLDGGRQIVDVHVPGDFADLHSFTLKRLDTAIVALTPVRVATVSHAGLEAITRDFPHLTRVLWFLTNLDAAIHREWEVSLGRRSALGRLAHLFCELRTRLALVGLADEGGYDCRLTQIQMGECMGLTSVHVNRTLRELRERGLVEVRRTRVDLLDPEGLEAVAEFTPDYLYLDGPSADI